MDATKVRTAFSTIQSNPWDSESWDVLAEELQSQDGDLSSAEAEELLRTARGKHAARGEFSAVQKLFELSTKSFGEQPEAIPLYLEQAKVALDHLFDGQLALNILNAASRLPGSEDEVESIAVKLRDEATSWQEKAASYLAEAEKATDDAYRSAMLM